MLIVPQQSGFQSIGRAGLIDLIGFEGVIRKTDFEPFINNLTTTEERYVRYRMVDELPDRTAAAALSMSVEKLHAMKETLRGKIDDHFTA